MDRADVRTRARLAATVRPVAFALAAAALCATPALAAGGGAAAPGSGGVTFVAKPEIKGVKCLSSCMSRGRVKSGGKLKLRGDSLSDVTQVVYRGASGASDDVTVRVRPASDSSLTVPVPMRAQSGRLDAYANKKVHTATRSAVTIMPPPAPTPNPHLSPVSAAGSDALETATSRTMFAIDQRRGVTFSFRFGHVPSSVAVSLVRLDDDNSVVKTWSPTPPAAGKVGKVSWNGLAGRKTAAFGRYAFRLSAVSGGGAKTANAAATDIRRDAFDLRPAVFPIKGQHSYGGSGNRFGAGRSGHTHQGQDVLAACGRPLVAARGGVVKARQYQSNAGYYIVIDGQSTGVDYGYMHLRAPSPYAVGDRVHTGDQIGVVGDTGDATACHLHFEEWKSPGWYSGGSPFDPLADLRAWDAYS
jgi:murein DD-endopeptidase MepM/ murein hydrolase activator NlpD